MSNIARQSWEVQATDVYSKTSGIVKSTWYTAFEDITGWKKLHSIAIQHDNTGHSNENLGVRFTLDGVTFGGTSFYGLNAIDLLWPYRRYYDNGMLYSTSRVLVDRYTPLDSENIKVEITHDSAVPAGAEMWVWTQYSKFKSF